MQLPAWPELDYKAASATYATLHQWTQIVGKIKLQKMPWFNHSWHLTLHTTPSGLSTLQMPDKNGHFSLDFDFLRHTLNISTSQGIVRSFALPLLSVASCYNQLMDALNQLGYATEIHTTPNELPNPLPFPENHAADYQPAHAMALHQALLNSASVFQAFRSRFIGKCSPVHFFWGSFDLAVTRFSGNEAPIHPGGVPNLPNWVAREAYSHEVSSAGFWPGDTRYPEAAFYSYAYPEPPNFREAKGLPKEAFFSEELGEYVLPYKEVQKAQKPAALLLNFLEATYVAAADNANWNRKELEAPQSFKIKYS
jgi:hypothetical protein